jgi:cation diffusion facilitator family transporter
VIDALTHRHGPWTHAHRDRGAHRHPLLPVRSAPQSPPEPAPHPHDHRDHGDHGHSHGLVDRSIVRSRDGVRAVMASLAALGITAALQVAVFVASGSVALFADLIHNAGDALTAIPLAIAFVLRSRRSERWAGYVVVLTIFASALVAGAEAVDRLLHPQALDHLWILALAGAVGFAGNELAARVRLRAGRRLASAALIADGHHARVDGWVSLGVVPVAAATAIGVPRADPIVGLAICALILHVAWQAWQTVQHDED